MIERGRRAEGRGPEMCRGNVTVEWTLVTILLFGALFLPVDGERSAMELFVEAVQDYNGGTTFLLSLP